MRQVVKHLVWALGLAVATATVAAAQETMPEGVTKEMIEEGAKLFSGLGICMVCHGADGAGVPNLGADLTDDEWAHSDGSFEGILKTIKEGVSSEKSTSRTVMPPKGGSSLNNEQLKAVAAYVWSLSHKK